MIDHDAAQALAAAALDFDLSPEDDQNLLAHVIECDTCRAFTDALDADARAITGLASDDAPAGLRARILDAIPAPADQPADQTVTSAPRPPESRGVVLAIPRRYRGPLALTAAAAVVVALVGGMLVWRPSPSGAPNVAGASASATAPTGSGDRGTPVPTVEPGSRLAAGPWTPVADLTADDVTSGVVGLASGFRLKMLDGTSAIEAARRLEVEPPVSFTTTAEPDGTVKITPTEPLTPGAAYRFSLSAADGHEVGTWAFQAHQPLRVVATLPGDTETSVPSDTGIEVTFDQDGVVDAESHVTIEPSIDGRYEMHGRTLAFVPAKRLAPATIYTVTVSPGIAVGSTDQKLEQGFTFKFETAALDAAAHTSTLQFSDELFESSSADRPIVAVWFFGDSEEDEENPPPPPTSAPLEIYRVDGIDAAMDTYRAIRAIPRWTRLGSADLVPTTGLTQVMALDARLQESDGVLWTELPDRLPAGWYLVQHPSPTRPIQAMLQVTDIASYLVVSDTKTLLWANDLATKGPLAGAMVATTGADLGRTGADGTLLTTTPPALEPEPQGTCALPCVSFVTVKDGARSAFVPASEASDPDGKGFGSHPTQDEGLQYWHSLLTDRTLYRSTDTVNAWGVIRDRDTGRVPDEVTIALTQDEGSDQVRPAIVTKTAHPNAIGAFTSSIGLDALPEGSYALELRTGGQLVTSVGFQVDRILKPAYRLDVTTGRRIYVEGDQIRITAQATFYEGTPVPGITLRAEEPSVRFKTGATGTDSRKIIAHVTHEEGDENTGPEIQSITITPATSEEGEITSSSREIVIFPSHWTIAGTATIGGGRVRATGVLSEIARDRLEREVAAGADPWSLDAAGKAIANRTVTLTFYDNVTSRVSHATRYDFIEKKVVPIYEYTTTERIADTVNVRTDSKGRYTASIRARDGHAYRIRATAKDTDGHTAAWIDWANQPDEQEGTDSSPILTLTADPELSGSSFGVGDTIDVRMSDPTAAGEGATDRYLFTTAQRGLRDVVVQDSPRFRTTFGRTAPPSLQVAGVRFNGSRYSITTTFEAGFETSDRALTVGLSTDAARYLPGDDVQLSVTTRDHSGDPVAATVVLRAVDAKLFTLGGAEAADPIGELYAGVGSGINVIYRSHRTPTREGEFGGGDTTGGGRDDFRDSLLFMSVDTGSDGRAKVTIHLSDDLTSWRVSATAIGAGLTAGEGSIDVPVGLPFFVEATVAPEYLVSDRPEIGLRAFGTALDATSGVTFAVDADSLGLHVDGLTADAFETVRVPLPALSLGRHEVTITARSGSGSNARVDRLTRSFTVIGSRLEQTRTGYKEITGVTHIDGGTGLTEITVSDAGVGRYAPLILGLTDTTSGRLENTLAADVASSLARSRFAAADAASADAFDGSAYQTPDGGLSLVPYASSDLEVSVLAALIAPERFEITALTQYLTTVAADPKETRERKTFALAGLAGLGASVLPRVRAAADDPDLTIRERLLLGIGAAKLGDAGTAHAIAASLIEGYGEAAGGDQARLRVGSDAADVTEATALMAMLAAAIDDPLATRFWSYVDANPVVDETYALHAVGFVTRLLEHATPTAGSFAYTSGGKRTVVTLKPGEAFHLALVPSQVPDFTIEPVTGAIAVTTSWREPVDPASFAKDPDIKVFRTIKPSGAINAGDLVTVELVVDLGARSNLGCRVVTDFVPSGLVPVGRLRAWVDPEDTEGTAANATSPYAEVGQRVDFCAEPRSDGENVHLRYVARVISTGKYTWETAIAQSPFADDRAALTGATTITIR